MLLNLLTAQVAEGQSRFVGFGEAALYGLIGYAVVFFGIAFLIFIVWAVGQVLSKNKGKAVSKNKAVQKEEKEAVAENVNTAKTENVVETEEISEETIAIITAAIMAYYEQNNPKCEFTLKRIKRI